MMKTIMLPLIFVNLWLFESTHSIQSEEFNDCRHFFYQNEPPQVIPEMTNTSKCLCERYNNEYYFATLYDTAMKIPVYSAYKIEIFLRPDNDDGKRKWRKGENLTRNEQPQLSDYNGVQAKQLNRGHLATRFYFPTSERRRAADVLTNIAPQYEDFNKYTWLSLERDIYKASKEHCKTNGGKSYFITGVLPSSKEFFKDKINIPSYFWTAVCCDTSGARNDDRFKDWSFAYMVRNVNNKKNNIEVFTVENFVQDWRIKNRYRKLFKDITVYKEGEEKRNVNNCLFDSEKTYEIIQSIITKNHKDLFIYNRLALKRIPLNDYLTNTLKKMKNN